MVASLSRLHFLPEAAYCYNYSSYIAAWLYLHFVSSNIISSSPHLELKCANGVLLLLDSRPQPPLLFPLTCLHICRYVLPYMTGLCFLLESLYKATCRFLFPSLPYLDRFTKDIAQTMRNNGDGRNVICLIVWVLTKAVSRAGRHFRTWHQEFGVLLTVLEISVYRQLLT